MLEDTGRNPQQRLWAAVLLRTVEDALIGVPNETRISRIRICEEARTYLTTPSKDLAEVCALAGLDMQAVIDRMRNRIKDAPTPEELADNPGHSGRFNKAPAKPVQPRPAPFKDQVFTINGESRTAAEWCAQSGIPLARAYSRIKQLWPADQALTMTPKEVLTQRRAQSRALYQRQQAFKQASDTERRKRTATAATYEFNGESLTLAEWADRTGIKKATIDKRLRSGWSISEALSTPARPKADAA